MKLNWTLCLTLAACGAPAETSPPAAGDVAPSVLASREADGPVTIAWLTDADSCLACDGGAAARSLRQVRLAYGDRVVLVVYAVGGEIDMVENFIRAERIRAEVVPMAIADYESTFGSAPLPAVYLIHGNRILDSYHDSPAARLNAITSGRGDIMDALEGVLGPGEASPEELLQTIQGGES